MSYPRGSGVRPVGNRRSEAINFTTLITGTLEEIRLCVIWRIPMADDKRPGVMKRLAVWIFTLLVALSFLGAGVYHVVLFAGGANAEEYAVRLEKWGYPEWFHLAIAAAHICGAILLLLRRTALIGGFVLLGVMGGAVYTHVRHGEYSELPSPVILIVLVGLAILWRCVRHPERKKE